MPQCFCNGQICIRQGNILADQTNRNLFGCLLLAFGHLNPFGQIRCAVFQTEVMTNTGCQTFLFQHHWNIIQRRSGHVLNNVFFPYIAKQADFLCHFLRNFLFGSANNDVWLNANGEQFFYGVLCWLGLQFVRAGNMYMAFCLPTSATNCRMASRNGVLSMSPTVPPISVMTTSVSEFLPTR